VGTELVKGIELALTELRKATTVRKMLIIITDGNDTNDDPANAALRKLKKLANGDRVELLAIVYKAADSGPKNIMTDVIPQAPPVKAADTIGASLQAVMQRLDDRQYLTFPGYDKSTKVGLHWDGKTHDLALTIDGQETDPEAVVLRPRDWAATRRDEP
jgi:hypothetical protein